jgi:hypothetical protein
MNAIAVAGLVAVATNAAEDLETMGAIMTIVGNHVPHEDITGDWLAWFGRQITACSEQLAEELKEVR